MRLTRIFPEIVSRLLIESNWDSPSTYIPLLHFILKSVTWFTPQIEWLISIQMQHGTWMVRKNCLISFALLFRIRKFKKNYKLQLNFTFYSRVQIQGINPPPPLQKHHRPLSCQVPPPFLNLQTVQALSFQAISPSILVFR